jgi:hypothetical protein
MDAELKARWVAALRSGEYEQGRRQLRAGDTYCCLGVLCVVASIPLNGIGTSCVSPSGADLDYRPLRDLLGDRGGAGELMAMNDLDRRSFAQIAAYIEANL